MQTVDTLIKAQDLAKDLGTTEGTLAQWRYRGFGPKFVKVGRHVRYRASDVQTWLDAQTRDRTGEQASA